MNDKCSIIIESGDPRKGNLYLGSYIHATNEDLLDELNIRYVLTALRVCGNYYGERRFHKKVQLEDTETQSLSTVLSECMDFIGSSLREGNVLVHCAAGISRSASLVIAYLIMTRKITYEEALKYVQTRRSIVQPNENFEKQLKALAGKCQI